LLTIGLIPYLPIATARNTLFAHKESTVTFEETMANAKKIVRTTKKTKESIK
jgi:hypothetical protein